MVNFQTTKSKSLERKAPSILARATTDDGIEKSNFLKIASRKLYEFQQTVTQFGQ